MGSCPDTDIDPNFSTEFSKFLTPFRFLTEKLRIWKDKRKLFGSSWKRIRLNSLTSYKESSMIQRKNWMKQIKR